MDLRELNFKLTKERLQKETSRDILIIQTNHTLNEIKKAINSLLGNLRERYGYYAARASRIEDREKFLEVVNKKIREDIGLELNQKDLESITDLAKQIKNLIELENSQKVYLEELTKELCPNLYKIATPMIAAGLIDHAGSLKHLAEIPSSTIQVLGAEKALFRHLKSGAKAPKFGVIFSHPKINEALPENKGKAARHLSNEISKAAKIDFFRHK